MGVWYCDVDMAADEDLGEEEMDLAFTEGPDLVPLSALAPRKSIAPFRSRDRGENNERGGAERGPCAVLDHTHSKMCRNFE